jgi:uncharacterized membrane protein
MKRTERPVLDITYSPQDVALEAAALGSLLLNTGMVALFWSGLPARVPTHFDWSGRADAWGNKSTLLILPGVSLVLYLMLTIVNRYPHTFNYPWPITAQNAAEQYRLARSLLAWLKVEVIILFTLLEWVTIQTALGHANGLGVIFLPITTILILGTLAFYFYFAYRAR